LVDLGAGVRAAAAGALARLDTPLAHEGLVRALRDPQESVRVAAVDGLRDRGDPVASELLTTAAAGWTRPEDAPARQHALDALASLDAPGALRRTAAELLMRPEALDDADAEVVRRLKQAARDDEVGETIGDLVADLEHGDVPERARTLLVWLAPESVEPLVGALSDPRVQREAALALGSMHDSRAVEPLCSLVVGSSEAGVRQAAAWALGEIRDPAAVEPLLIATGDADYEVRTAAGDGFDKLGNAAIAVAMSALVRPALANGARPDEGLPEAAPAAPAAVPESPAQPRPLPPRPTPEPLATRAAPILRRLLGRRAGL
jgi:HEAT repeat protein